VLKDNGLRLLLVGYESGNQQILHNIKKGMRIEVAKKFTKDCHELGIKIHGTFILGLPGETKETIEETIKFATEINPHTIQVSLAAPYPGTFLYKQAVENGWLDAAHAELVDDTACRSRRCTIRICRTPKSSIRSRPSTSGSISARRRSPRSSARWCAARR
jgi:radical SAM superfamily enzyme